ncbi:unnamed protein product [Echinostoma caproni]|uniref:Uncharacterized protein n=1 Tax=Echinostoma caproni TaxID=27848 RepID=A0A183AZ80_9TREM|nr:unnamed protein product [Echinostoma caproni]
MSFMCPISWDFPVFYDASSNEKVSDSPLPVIPTTSRCSREFDSKNSQISLIRQAIGECRERLALLSSLEKLRTARVSQARQRGGLYPEAFDQAFTAQVNELINLLRSQLTKLLAAEKTQVRKLTMTSL